MLLTFTLSHSKSKWFTSIRISIAATNMVTSVTLKYYKITINKSPKKKNKNNLLKTWTKEDKHKPPNKIEKAKATKRGGPDVITATIIIAPTTYKTIPKPLANTSNVI